MGLELTIRDAESEQLVPVAPVQLVVVSATTRQLPPCSPLPPEAKIVSLNLFALI